MKRAVTYTVQGARSGVRTTDHPTNGISGELCIEAKFSELLVIIDFCNEDRIFVRA